MEALSPRKMARSPQAASMTDLAVSFRHDPLDHTIQSLRLVHLLPELSSTGHIQCTITHATTEALYVCLSYTWGEPDIVEGNHILINGLPFPVRQNLLDFLHMMQSTASRYDVIFNPLTGYWIDALCIDQRNEAEKNHQVAQMGCIFSKAQFVHVWLGAYSDTAGIRVLPNGPAKHKGEAMRRWRRQIRRNMHVIKPFIFDNKYWTRAWIIQEIMLAQRGEVSLGAHRFALIKLFRHARLWHQYWEDSHFAQFTPGLRDATRSRDADLVTLLYLFREKECALVEDRIFSLLALCNDGQGIPVRYDLSRTELAYHVLQHSRPTTCACAAFIVAQALDLGVYPRTRQPKQAFLHFDIANVVGERALRFNAAKGFNFYMQVESRPRIRLLSEVDTLLQRYALWGAKHPECTDMLPYMLRNSFPCGHIRGYLASFFARVIDWAFAHTNLPVNSEPSSRYFRLCDVADRAMESNDITLFFGDKGDRSAQLVKVDKDHNILSFRVALSCIARSSRALDKECSTPATVDTCYQNIRFMLDTS